MKTLQNYKQFNESLSDVLHTLENTMAEESQAPGNFAEGFAEFDDSREREMPEGYEDEQWPSEEHINQIEDRYYSKEDEAFIDEMNSSDSDVNGLRKNTPNLYQKPLLLSAGNPQLPLHHIQGWDL